VSRQSRVARALWFAAPRRAELREEPVADPGEDQVLVRGLVSLISSGTEMRVYRGEVDPSWNIGLETFGGSLRFPVKYAYQIVGVVERAGAGSGYAPGQRVFARHPHQEAFTIRNKPFLLFPLPPDLPPKRAAFANLLDVALTCMLDVPIRIGDAVVVYGQGVVGSFCAQLARRTAGVLVVVDPIERRRRTALEWGADAAVAPAEAPGLVDELTQGRGADVSIEASGAPAALQQAVRVTGEEGVIAVVSFFGSTEVPLVLAPEFHFRRQHITSSQVRRVGAGLQPRWTLERRMQTVFRLLADDALVTPVTHVLPFSRAPEAYALLDAHPEDTLGILLSYED
jgi:threonine dehydrogenase-like Zn-dependent dehydrogenase